MMAYRGRKRGGVGRGGGYITGLREERERQKEREGVPLAHTPQGLKITTAFVFINIPTS